MHTPHKAHRICQRAFERAGRAGHVGQRHIQNYRTGCRFGAPQKYLTLAKAFSISNPSFAPLRHGWGVVFLTENEHVTCMRTDR